MNIDILIKYFSGQSQPEEAMQIHEWKSLNKENLELFTHLLQEWHPEYDYHSDEEFFRLWRKLEKNKSSDRNPNWLKVSGLAASLIILISIIYTVYFNAHPGIIELSYTGVGAENVYTMPDSNMVILSKHSIVEYYQEQDSVRYTISGSATIDVKNHSNRLNFYIGHGIYIKDIGTIFDIRNDDDKIEIEVETGKVSVTRNDFYSEIEKNDILTYYIASQTFIKSSRVADIQWENISLGDALDELNRTFNIHVKVKNPALISKKISLIASELNWKDVLTIISETLNVKFENSNDEIFIY